MVPKHPHPVFPPNFLAPQPASRALMIFLIMLDFYLNLVGIKILAGKFMIYLIGFLKYVLKMQFLTP